MYLYSTIVFAAIAASGTVIGLLSSAGWIAEANIMKFVTFLVRMLTAAALAIAFLKMHDLKMLGYKWTLSCFGVRLLGQSLHVIPCG